MKELDVLLEQFLQRNGQALGEGRWPEFEQLLALEDDQLWDWLQSPETADPRFTQLLGNIRHVSGPTA